MVWWITHLFSNMHPRLINILKIIFLYSKHKIELFRANESYVFVCGELTKMDAKKQSFMQRKRLFKV